MKGRRKVTKEDKEWARQVKVRDEGRCVICGAIERLNAHHIIPREIEETTHDLQNGISLCPTHHRFSRQLSAHQNPLAFFIWMEKNRNYQLNYLKGKLEAINGTGRLAEECY